MINSKAKGKRGELEIARKLREHGYDCRRGQQYNGASGDADVIGLPGMHLEIKRRERLNLYDAMAQAKHDCLDDRLPAVMHRKNNCKWLVTMELDDWMTIYREWEAGMAIDEVISK